MSSSLASLGGLPNLGETGSAGLPATSSGRPVKRVTLNRRQKVAVIVRLLVGEGAKLPLADWPEDMQEALTQAMGQLRRVDRESLEEVVEEFSDELQSIGLSFSGGIEGALGLLDGHISPATSARLRREAGVAAKGDPWERIGALETDKLQTVLEEEGIEVGIISGRVSGASEYRARELGISILHQRVDDKVNTYRKIIAEKGLVDDQVCYMGDDLADIPLMREVGFSVAVADGSQYVKEVADYVTVKNGGNGAVREVCELILKAQDKWDTLMEKHFGSI